MPLAGDVADSPVIIVPYFGFYKCRETPGPAFARGFTLNLRRDDSVDFGNSLKLMALNDPAGAKPVNFRTAVTRFR